MTAKAPNALATSKNGNAAPTVVVPRGTTLALEAKEDNFPSARSKETREKQWCDWRATLPVT